MTLRKITVDNSVRDIPKSEQTREIEQNIIMNTSTPRKQKKKISQNKKNSVKIQREKDSVYLNEQLIVTFN